MTDSYVTFTLTGAWTLAGATLRARIIRYFAEENTNISYANGFVCLFDLIL